MLWLAINLPSVLRVPSQQDLGKSQAAHISTAKGLDRVRFWTIQSNNQPFLAEASGHLKKQNC